MQSSFIQAGLIPEFRVSLRLSETFELADRKISRLNESYFEMISDGIGCVQCVHVILQCTFHVAISHTCRCELNTFH